LAEYIRVRLGVEYANAEDWGLDYSDGYASDELLRREGWDIPNGPCFTDLCRTIGMHRWCEHHPYHDSEEDLLIMWWQDTVDHITHRRRFFIFSDPLYEEDMLPALWYPSPQRTFDAIRDPQ
jgi:hypothetical protein